MTSSCNQSEEALIAALKAGQGFELKLCRGPGYTADLFLEPGGQSIYKVGRYARADERQHGLQICSPLEGNNIYSIIGVLARQTAH